MSVPVSVDAKLNAIISFLTAPCDGKYGDEVVKMDPKDWHGDSLKGARMSHCPPGFLTLLAETYDYFAAKDGDARTEKGALKGDYSRATATRARGWSLRRAAGWAASGVAATPDAGLLDDDIAF